MFLKINFCLGMILSKEIQAMSTIMLKMAKDKELKGFRYQKTLSCQKETLKAKPTTMLILSQAKAKN